MLKIINNHCQNNIYVSINSVSINSVKVYTVPSQLKVDTDTFRYPISQ